MCVPLAFHVNREPRLAVKRTACLPQFFAVFLLVLQNTDVCLLFVLLPPEGLAALVSASSWFAPQILKCQVAALLRAF
jgi:hypothetical protein